MSKSISWAVACACFLASFQSAYGQAIPAWKPADYWFLDVEVFPREAAPAPPMRNYQINVLVSGKSQIGGVPCWTVGFLPGKPVPANLGDNYSISVAQDKGWPVNIIYYARFKRVPEPALLAGALGLGMPLESLGLVGATPGLKQGITRPTEQPQWLERFGDAGFITAAVPGYPMEVFPLIESGPLPAAKSGARLSLAKHKDGEFTVVEALLKVDDKEKLLVRQKWIDGEKWWREYERYIDGKKDLEARREMPATNKPSQIEVPADKIGTRDDPLYLHRDPKLHAKVEVEAKGAKLADLLERLRQATGLNITLDDALTGHNPDLGYIQPTKNGWSARAVMSIIQTAQLENGFWEKTPDGYKLTGKSLVSVPEAQVSASSSRWWLIPGIVALVLAAGILVVWYRLILQR